MMIKSEFIKLNPDSRLYQLPVPLIGLTGGIASGKSTVSKLLEAKGLAVIDADKLVKEVYKLPSTLLFLKQNHPDVLKDETIQFPLLREKFFKHPEVKANIETFIYSHMPEAFALNLKKIGTPPFVIYDVPLLFEKKLEHFFDRTILVYAPRPIQKQRLMERDKINEAMAEIILNHQMDIEIKKKKADVVIENSQGLDELKSEVEFFLSALC